MEIERKFLMKGLPDLKEEKHVRITQGYLTTEPEVRIRSYEVISGRDKGHIDHLLTIKGNGDLIREEVETYITEGQFDALAKMIGKPLIEKDYWKYMLDGRVLEVAIVDPGTDDEFCYGEVEFLTKEEAENWKNPFPNTKDVTYDKIYKMKNYWIRTRVERRTAEEIYQQFKLARNTLCEFCGKCFIPKIVDKNCDVQQLAERLHDKAVEDGITEE